ncbi:MAG: hypothetical protein QOF49_1967 [Chloroflexota bacterium]|jgi:hypothetical protein|nr:hypothetical protein [Chloroflexota bacterium]
MTGDPRALSGDDELVLEAIGRRLGELERELPRLASWQADRAGAGQLHVVRGRMRRAVRRPRSTGPAADRVLRRDRLAPLRIASVAMAAVVAVAVVATLRTGDVGRPIQPTTLSAGPAFSFGPRPSAAASAPAASASAAPSPPSGSARPTPASSSPTTGSLSVVEADPGAIHAVLGQTGWRCGVLVEVALPILDPLIIDKLARASAVGGSLPVGAGPGWIGSDPKRAAGLFKGRLIHVDSSRGLWILRGAGSRASVLLLTAVPAPAGLTIWRSADVMWPADCPPVGTDVKALIGGRAAGDWPDAQVVDLTIVRARSFVAPPGEPS